MRNPSPEDVDLARTFLRDFVLRFRVFYGQNSLSHNVHVLLHLPDYVELYGNLPSISAFKFENFMQEIKRNLTKKHQHLQQLQKRIAEQYTISERTDVNQFSDRFQLKKNLLGCSFAYRTCYFDQSLMISANGKDDCVLTNGVPAKVLGFAESEGQTGAIIREFSELRPFFRSRIESSRIGVWFSSSLKKDYKFVHLDKINKKLVKLPFGNGFVLITLLHIGYD